MMVVACQAEAYGQLAWRRPQYCLGYGEGMLCCAALDGGCLHGLEHILTWLKASMGLGARAERVTFPPHLLAITRGWR